MLHYTILILLIYYYLYIFPLPVTLYSVLRVLVMALRVILYKHTSLYRVLYHMKVKIYFVRNRQNLRLIRVPALCYLVVR